VFNAVQTLLIGFALWLLLSGYFEPLMLSFGLLSCALVALLAHRLQLTPAGEHRPRLHLRLLSYLPWLFVEIVRSNIDVARRIWNPALPISPSMVRARADQRTSLGLLIHANSITLTPGTLSVDVSEDGIIVHGLSREVTEAVIDSDMNRRISAMEAER